MNKNVSGSTLEEFVEGLIEASTEGFTPSGNVRVSGFASGSSGRLSIFDVITKECGKIYEARGVTDMVGTVSSLSAKGRQIRSVTPIGMFKDKLMNAEYATVMLAPVEEPVEELEEAPVESITEDDEEIEVDIGLTEVDLLPSDTELTALPKKELLQMLKDAGLSGNIQQSKGVLIKRLRGEE